MLSLYVNDALEYYKIKMDGGTSSSLLGELFEVITTKSNRKVMAIIQEVVEGDYDSEQATTFMDLLNLHHIPQRYIKKYTLLKYLKEEQSSSVTVLSVHKTLHPDLVSTLEGAVIRDLTDDGCFTEYDTYEKLLGIS